MPLTGTHTVDGSAHGQPVLLGTVLARQGPKKLRICLPAWNPQQACEAGQDPGPKPGETGNTSCPRDSWAGAAPTLNPWDYQSEGPRRFS